MNLGRLVLVAGSAALIAVSLLVLVPRWQNYRLKAALEKARRYNGMLRHRLQQLHDYPAQHEAQSPPTDSIPTYIVPI